MNRVKNQLCFVICSTSAVHLHNFGRHKWDRHEIFLQDLSMNLLPKLQHYNFPTNIQHPCHCNQSGRCFNNCIDRNTLSASSGLPLSVCESIMDVHAITFFFSIRSNSLEEYSKTPHFEYVIIREVTTDTLGKKSFFMTNPWISFPLCTHQKNGSDRDDIRLEPFLLHPHN